VVEDTEEWVEKGKRDDVDCTVRNVSCFLLRHNFFSDRSLISFLCFSFISNHNRYSDSLVWNYFSFIFYFPF
jgi:hypothetical protein